METTVTQGRGARLAFDASALAARYELLEEVGRGGMGVVHRARHRLLGQQVAIKFHALAHGGDRFLREARLLASVRSPHVVAVHDFDVSPEGQSVLVMSWVAGSDLAKLVEASPEALPEARVVPWMRQVCEGMGAAAEQGIVHRDLKPANVLIDAADRALVADFGIARSALAEPLTQAGGVVGTPHYMAPEQAEDPRSVDTRADIYSFGATFYQALTRATPFEGKSWFSILFSHKTEPLVAPQSRNPALSARVNDCLERCLAKSPRDRFQTFAEVARHLTPQPAAADPRGDPWGDAGGEADGPEVARHLARFAERRPVYLGGLPEALPAPDLYEFPHGRTCTVGFGDLTRQKVDALVSSDDEMLTMGGGVSAALARAAGGDYALAARVFTPARPGRAVATPAGNLPARFVLHGVTLGGWGKAQQAPTRDLLNEIMESCFYHADTLGLRSVAFPLLGTGVGRFSPAVCLDTMFRFVARKLLRGLTTVREVRIVLNAEYPPM